MLTNTILMADGQGTLSIFSELVIAPDDVSGQWNRFIKQFDIMVEWKNLDAGTKMVTHGTGAQARGVVVDRFTDQIEYLSLLKSPGQGS